MVVPPHAVNVKLGNRQHVMIGGGKSFGAYTMTEILAKADLLPGVDSTLSERLYEDRVMLARLQNSAIVWDIMERCVCLDVLFFFCVCVVRAGACCVDIMERCISMFLLCDVCEYVMHAIVCSIHGVPCIIGNYVDSLLMILF
jgi:hypothetical protein